MYVWLVNLRSVSQFWLVWPSGRLELIIYAHQISKYHWSQTYQGSPGGRTKLCSGVCSWWRMYKAEDVFRIFLFLYFIIRIEMPVVRFLTFVSPHFLSYTYHIPLFVLYWSALLGLSPIGWQHSSSFGLALSDYRIPFSLVPQQTHFSSGFWNSCGGHCDTCKSVAISFIYSSVPHIQSSRFTRTYEDHFLSRYQPSLTRRDKCSVRLTVNEEVKLFYRVVL